KSVSGYDVPKLMVGALGTLGVLTELTLRLHPLPDSERSWLVPLDRPQAAQDFVARLIDSPLQPSRVELFNDHASRLLLAESGSAGGASVAEMAAVTTRVRAWVGEIGGSAVIARGSVELRGTVDPWGPVEPGALGLMRALRNEFDPRRVLNPGRYVGGL